MTTQINTYVQSIYGKNSGLFPTIKRVGSGSYIVTIQGIEYSVSIIINEDNGKLVGWRFSHQWLYTSLGNDDIFSTYQYCLMALVDMHFMSYHDATTLDCHFSRSLVQDSMNQATTSENILYLWPEKYVKKLQGKSNCVDKFLSERPNFGVF